MRARVVSSLIVLLLALASPAQAADRRGENTPSLDRILPQIRQHTPGTFYDAEGPFLGPDGSVRYRLKWMTPDGRITWFDVDGRSGRVLGGYAAPGRRFDSDRFDNFGGPPSRYDDRHQDGDRQHDGWGRDRDDRRGRNGGDYGGDRRRGNSGRRGHD